MKKVILLGIVEFFVRLRRSFFPRTSFEAMIKKTSLSKAVAIFEPSLTSADWAGLTMRDLYDLLCHQGNQAARQLYIKRVSALASEMFDFKSLEYLFDVHGKRVGETSAIFGERSLEIAQRTSDLIWAQEIVGCFVEDEALNRRVLNKMLELAKNEKDAREVYDRSDFEDLKQAAVKLCRSHLNIAI